MTAPGVLAGIRVVDFSWVLAGPMATKMLAGMGAEVIKIESGARPEHVQRYPWSAVVNAGKLSCTINLGQPEGPALIRRLIGMSDMVVENFSAGVLAKYGLDYAALRDVRPDLIFVSASGTGRAGPQRNALAYGTLLQAYSGRAGMIATPNPRLEAMGILPAWTDPITALWESCAMLAAIRHRRRTGEGAFIDLSMLESTVALLPESLFREALGSGGAAPAATATPAPPRPAASAAPGTIPGSSSRCAATRSGPAFAPRWAGRTLPPTPASGTALAAPPTAPRPRPRRPPGWRRCRRKRRRRCCNPPGCRPRGRATSARWCRTRISSAAAVPGAGRRVAQHRPAVAG
ncbi:MAG: CoA transferase [Acetobacteraceae bacterium]